MRIYITNGHLLVVRDEDILLKAQKCKVNKQQKMLLSLRSNPQTKEPNSILSQWTAVLSASPFRSNP